MSTFLLVLMGIFFIVPTIIYKQYMLSLAFIIFGLVFGFVEFLSNYYTGKTVSQMMWQLMTTNKKEGYIVIICMLLAWCCLLAHLAIRFKK